MRRVLDLPHGMPITRFRPKPRVELPEGTRELPLFDKDTPPDQQIQQVWVARARVFDLTDDTQRGDYEKVWQLVCDGQARVSENSTEFHDGRFLAFLRWAEFDYKVPESCRPPSATTGD